MSKFMPDKHVQITNDTFEARAISGLNKPKKLMSFIDGNGRVKALQGQLKKKSPNIFHGWQVASLQAGQVLHLARRHLFVV